MKTIKALLTLISSIAFLTIAVAASSPELSQDEDLIYIGMADGYHYFANPNLTTLNWMASRDYCNASNLTLASIRTVNQRNLLLEFFDSHRGEYWVSGRELRVTGSPLGLVWNENPDPLDGSLFVGWGSMVRDPRDPIICSIVYYLTGGIYGATAYCTEERGRPICQTR